MDLPIFIGKISPIFVAKLLDLNKINEFDMFFYVNSC